MNIRGGGQVLRASGIHSPRLLFSKRFVAIQVPPAPVQFPVSGPSGVRYALTGVLDWFWVACNTLQGLPGAGTVPADGPCLSLLKSPTMDEFKSLSALTHGQIFASRCNLSKLFPLFQPAGPLLPITAFESP